MKRVLFLGICVLALLSSVALDASAQANLVLAFDAMEVGSWTRSLALSWDGTVAPYGFNEVRVAYRPDLDLGGGAFEEPVLSDFRDGGSAFGSPNFAGPLRSDWQTVASGATYGRATGTTLSDIWLPFRVHHAGDSNYESGLSIAWYLDGNYLDSAALHWSGTTGGFLSRSEQEWDADWASAVPEPTTLTLLGFGLLGAAVTRKRKLKT